MKCGCLIYFFLNSANLIYEVRIPQNISESLRLRDNESPLYFSYHKKITIMENQKLVAGENVTVKKCCFSLFFFFFFLVFCKNIFTATNGQIVTTIQFLKKDDILGGNQHYLLPYR